MTSGVDLIAFAYRKQKLDREVLFSVRAEHAMAHASYISGVENFTGTKSGFTVDDFIDALEGAFDLIESSPVPAGAAASQLDDKFKCSTLRLKLRGEARAWLRSDAELPVLADWEDLTKRLRERFRPRVSHTALQQAFKACVQRHGETPTAYATRLRLAGQELAQALPAAADETEKKIRRKLLEIDTLSFYLDGLLPSISRFVNARQPKTLEEAIGAAEDETRAAQQQADGELRVAALPARPVEPQPSTSGSSSDTMDAFVAALRGSMPLTCYYCGAKDHWYADCPRRRADGNFARSKGAGTRKKDYVSRSSPQSASPAPSSASSQGRGGSQNTQGTGGFGNPNKPRDKKKRWQGGKVVNCCCQCSQHATSNIPAPREGRDPQ